MEVAVNFKVLHSRTLQLLYYIKKTELKVNSPIFTRVNIRNKSKVLVRQLLYLLYFFYYISFIFYRLLLIIK
jgi:hypothetical protein